MKYLLTSLIALLTFGNAAWAAGVYKWTDASGRVHFSDVPPVDKGAEAQKLDVKKSELTETQKKELATRLAKEKELAKVSAGKPAVAASAALSSEATASGAKQSASATSCEEAWKKYNESYACFDPYRMKDGRVRPEGFERCVQLPMPERCK